MDQKVNGTVLPESDGVLCEQVLDWFKLFACVPHGSWNEKELADLLERECVSRGWAVERDGMNNLKVDIPGAPGLEHLPPILLQGHIDMVCAVTEGSGYVPERDPITLVVEDGVLRSDGRSSLGADNGLGNSAALTALEKDLKRGPVRFLFTTAEEVGLHGANRMDPAWLEGCRYLINTDCGPFGSAVIACAGGRREGYTRPVEFAAPRGSAAFELRLHGFKGGHSGVDIHLGLGNAIKLAALFLNGLKGKVDYELADLKGGHAHNAIPLEASALLVVEEENVPALKAAAEDFHARMNAYYRVTDPGARAELTEVPLPGQVWSKDSRDAAVDFINLLHNGVFAMHDSLRDQVAASGNVGQCAVNGKGEFEVLAFTRCTSPFAVEQLACRHDAAAKCTGFAGQADEYPGWEGDPNSPLVHTVAEVYRRQTGKELAVSAVHAGLEPAVLGAKAPNLEMVSIGPDVQNPHSTVEYAPLHDLPAFVRLVAAVLEELSAQK